MDKRIFTRTTAIFFSIFLIGCSSLQVNHSKSVAVPDNEIVAVIPLSNLTETPHAGERATNIATDLLRIKGFKHVAVYPTQRLKPSIIPGVKAEVNQTAALDWARQKGAAFALTGSVSEWNYKVGMDGEPAVGFNLGLVDLSTGKHIWSAVGSESGSSRSAVSETAIHLMSTLMQTMNAVQA